MLKKVVLSLVLGTIGGSAATGWALSLDVVQEGLLSLASLGTAGAALVAGIMAGSVAPKLFEVIMAGASVALGTFSGLMAFGGSLLDRIQNAGGGDGLVTNITALLVEFSLSGGLIIICAVIGGVLVAKVRRRAERAYGGGPGAYS